MSESAPVPTVQATVYPFMKTSRKAVNWLSELLDESARSRQGETVKKAVDVLNPDEREILEQVDLTVGPAGDVPGMTNAAGFMRGPQELSPDFYEMRETLQGTKTVDPLELRVTPDTLEKRPDYVARVLRHELAHGDDWMEQMDMIRRGESVQTPRQFGRTMFPHRDDAIRASHQFDTKNMDDAEWLAYMLKSAEINARSRELPGFAPEANAFSGLAPKGRNIPLARMLEDSVRRGLDDQGMRTRFKKIQSSRLPEKLPNYDPTRRYDPAEIWNMQKDENKLQQLRQRISTTDFINDALLGGR